MKRYGMISHVRPDKLDRYVELHRAVWPGVLDTIRQCHIENYTIFLKQLPDGEHYLFSYFEYTGDDFQADMAKMAADPETQRWWAECKPCMEATDPHNPPGEVWSPLDEIFHID